MQPHSGNLTSCLSPTWRKHALKLLRQRQLQPPLSMHGGRWTQGRTRLPMDQHPCMVEAAAAAAAELRFPGSPWACTCEVHPMTRLTASLASSGKGASSCPASSSSLAFSLGSATPVNRCTARWMLAGAEDNGGGALCAASRQSGDYLTKTELRSMCNNTWPWAEHSNRSPALAKLPWLLRAQSYTAPCGSGHSCGHRSLLHALAAGSP